MALQCDRCTLREQREQGGMTYRTRPVSVRPGARLKADIRRRMIRLPHCGTGCGASYRRVPRPLPRPRVTPGLRSRGEDANPSRSAR
jgi:hypothetical protein